MGVVNATLDGAEFPHPDPDTSWSRAQFGELLDALTQERKRTIRIEVRESDGSTFTDIIRAKRSADEHLAETAVPAQPETRRARRSSTPQLVEVKADGFIPGEDITVAVVVSSAEGSSTGVGRALLDLNHLPAYADEVLLVGRVSGNIATQPLS